MKNKLKLTEADIVRAVGDYLQVQRNLGKLMYVRNNTGAIPIPAGKNKRRYIRFGDKGSPDFLVWKPYDNKKESGYIPMNKWMRGIAIEAKSETGKQSADQLKWQADFERLGGEYYIVKSLDDLMKIIRK